MPRTTSCRVKCIAVFARLGECKGYKRKGLCDEGSGGAKFLYHLYEKDGQETPYNSRSFVRLKDGKIQIGASNALLACERAFPSNVNYNDKKGLTKWRELVEGVNTAAAKEYVSITGTTASKPFQGSCQKQFCVNVDKILRFGGKTDASLTSCLENCQLHHKGK